MNKNKVRNIRQVFGEVGQAIRQSPDPRRFSPKVLELLGDALGCQWGTYWMVDAKSHVLRPVTTWRTPAVDDLELMRDTASRTLSLSEGTAGHVWRNRKPVWSVNLAQDMCFPRSVDAEGAGLHGGVWLAIKTDTAVYGVIELLGTDLEPASHEILLAVENLGFELGHVVEDFIDERLGGSTSDRLIST